MIESQGIALRVSGVSQYLMMLAPDFQSPQSWLAVGPWIVGGTFLWAGAIKALAPHVFSAHLTSLGWIPPKLNAEAVVAAAGLESAWGTALLLGVAPRLMLPATVALLAVLTAVSWWGVKSGRTTDCGCYGGYVAPSIGQSIAINVLMAAVIIAAWVVLRPGVETPTWKLVAMLLVGTAFAGLAIISQQFLAKRGQFMIDLSPLKVGRRWRPRWGATPASESRELLVSYLGPDCPHCKKWVRVLNAMQHVSELPQVAGVVATSGEKLDTFVQTAGIRFPITTIPETLMNRLVWGVPTTVLVSNGRIQKQWKGNMPADFYLRFRLAFFPGDQRTTDNGSSANEVAAASS